MTVLTKADLGSTLLSSVYLGATQLLGGGGGSEFAFGGFEPAYLLDFVNDPSGAESALTFSRASTAMMRNSSGAWVSVGINEPRIGHHEWNGSEWVSKGLLKEGQATNLCLQSGDVSVSPWVRAGITAVASDGDWYRLQLDTSTTGHYLSQTASVYNGESHCISANVKKGEAKYVQLTTSTGFVNYSFVNFDLENGVVYSTTNMPEHYGIIDNGDDYTIYMSEVTNLNSGRFLLVLLDTLDAGRAQSFSGDGVSGVYVRNLQLEEGTLPSSPIPTNGSAVTRAADVMTQPAGTLPWSASALSLFMAGEVSGDSYTLLSWQVDANNRITHTLNTSDFTFAQAAAGTVDSVTGGSHTSGLSVPFAYATTHTSTGIYAAVNGSALTPDETPTALADLTGAATSLLPSGNYTIAAIAGWAVDIGDTGRLEGSNYGS